MPALRVRLGRHFFGDGANFLDGSGRHHHEIMRHGVVVDEHDRHRLAGFDDDERFVVKHLFGNRADNKDTDAEAAKGFANGVGLVRWQ